MATVEMADQFEEEKPVLEKELLQQRVSKDCVVKVLFQGKATQQAVEKLMAYLNLMKDTLPSGNAQDPTSTSTEEQ